MKTYSVKEIADLLNTNPETVRRWIRDKKLEATIEKIRYLNETKCAIRAEII